MKKITFTKPTKVGIARTLNDAGHRKSGSRHSKMVRGYSTPVTGWVSTQLDDGNFRIDYKVGYGTYNGVSNVGLTDEERMERHEHCTKIFINKLENYTKALIAKKYHAFVCVKMVDGQMMFGDFENRTYKPCKEVEGFVTVVNMEVK